MVNYNVIKVFVFQDHWMWREALVAVLGREADLELVGVAADIPEGLAALITAQPDVVVMDLRFHGETRGIEATTRIKAVLPHTQVILFTEFPEDTDLGKAVQAGASGFLLKKEVQDSSMIVDAIHAVHQGDAYLTRTAATRALREIKRLSQGGTCGLTEREIQILKLIAVGQENHEIARHLGITEHTTANHISNIFAKLNARNRTEAVAVARRDGLIE